MKEHDTPDEIDSDSVRQPGWGSFVILCVVVLGVQSIVGWTVYKSLEDWQERGTFGDMFGAVNALFSGLAFVGVIYAIDLQRRELRLQREELRLTREAMEKTATAQERTAELMSMEVDIAAQQHAASTAREKAEAEPRLKNDSGHSSGGGVHGRVAACKILNTGGDAFGLKIEMDNPEFSPKAVECHELLNNQKWTLSFDVPQTSERQPGVVTYRDLLGREFRLTFYACPEFHTLDFGQPELLSE